MPVISIPDNTKFNWSSPDQVTFNVKAVYTKKTSNTKVEKAEHIYETMLFREPNDGKWNRILASEIEGAKKIISKKEYGSSEIKNLKTLKVLDSEKQANTTKSTLPSVEAPPVFKSDKQLFYYIHDRLMATTPQMAKAYLYKVLSKEAFQNGHTLKPYTKMWLDKLIKNLKSYQYTFCQYPQVKDEQNGMIYFYNKDKSKFVRMVAYNEQGTWKLNLIDYYPPSQDIVNRLWKIKGNCTEKPNLEVKKNESFAIGDIVDVKFSNGTFPAEVKKQDYYNKNRYFVKMLQGGRSYWVESNVMQKSNYKKVEFSVGDNVVVKSSSGDFKGTITNLDGEKALIKFEDSGYKDMWVNKSNLSKL